MPTAENKTGFGSDEIISQAIAASGGYSRPHQYEAIITPPSKLQFDAVSLKRISLNCTSTFLPGRAFGVKNQENGGQITREVAHTPFFQELPLVFYLSVDLLEKRLFDNWQSMIYNAGTGNLEYPRDYYGTVTLVKHTKNTGVPYIATYEFMDAWPKVVGEVVQAYDGMNQISVLPVSMSYWQWNPEYSATTSEIIDDASQIDPSTSTGSTRNPNPIRTA